MICPAAVILAIVPLLAHSISLSRPAPPCPDCLNGGICLPSNERARGAQGIHAGAVMRCFCRSPWTGDSCQTQGFGEDDEVGGGKVRAGEVHMSLRTAKTDMQVNKLENGFEADIGTTPKASSGHKVLVVNFALGASADAALKDAETMRFAVYSSLCPSSPCPSGLVMEDIRVLSLSEDSGHRTEVRLAISPPSSVEAVKAEVEAQLQDENSNLRADAFGGLILHSGFQLADAQVLPQPVIEDVDSYGAEGDRQGGTSNMRLSGEAIKPAEDITEKAPNERYIPHRPDRSVSLQEREFTSCATYCITISALVFLCFTAAHVSVERACRWLYPAEIESADHADLDEFAQEEPPAEDQDFQLVRALLEVMKNPLGPVVIYAILMYVVQARARELTRGFGDPPEWADTCMKVLTVTNLSIVVVIVIQALHIGAETVAKEHRKAFIVHLYIHANMWFVGVMAAIRITEFVSSAALIYCALYMTPADCNVDAELSKSLWQGHSPPLLSLELKMCLAFVVQFLLVHKFESIRMGLHVLSLLHSNAADLQQRKEDLHFDFVRLRLLTKTANLTPLLAIITLAIKEVPIYVASDTAFRHTCLHTVQVVMWGYSLFIFISTILLPAGARIEVGDVATGVVTLASCTDYIVLGGNDIRDVMWRNTRRVFLLVAESIALMLAASVFFLRSEAGPAPVVPWPVMWTLFVMMQCIVVHLLMVMHEMFVAPFEDQVAGDQLFLLNSSIREVEGFMALGPMLGLVFLCGHFRAISVMRTGEMPQWVLTAINSVAQTLLLQLVVTLLEATLAGFMFNNRRKWSTLRSSKNTSFSRAASQDLTGLAYLESGGLNTSVDIDSAGLDDPAAVDFGTQPRSRGVLAIEEAMRRLDKQGPAAPVGQSPWWPPPGAVGGGEIDSTSHLDRSTSNMIDEDYEREFLATKFLNLFCTLGQASLTVTLYISTNLILIAIWTMDSDMPRKSYAPGDWRSSMFPLLPVSAPTSTAMETMVWFVALFFAVKGASGMLFALRNMYDAVSWATLNAYNKCSMLVDLIPLIALLCLMVQSRAASFHGINASPSYFVQAHMVVIVIALAVEVLASIATPAFTQELTRAEDRARLIPGIRLMLLAIELLAAVAMYWGLLVLLAGIVLMRAEDVVLANGTTGVPWRGTGKPPSLPAIAWNMWGLCILAFAMDAIHKAFHHIVARRRYREGSAHRGDWFAQNSHLAVVRYLHGAVLARQTALGAVLLGFLFIPLEVLAHHTSATGKELAISQGTISFMKLLFFVTGAILCVKTFLVFCIGFIEKPVSHGIFRDLNDNTVKKDTLTDTQPILERHISEGFASDESSNPFATAFRRLTLGLTACESLAIAALAVTLFVLLHQHSTMFSTGGHLNGSIYLFALYLFVHSAWSFSVLLGYESTKLDGLHDVVAVSPLILILFMTCRQRAMEVAGRHGVVPEWMQHLILSCSVILFLEFTVVALAPAGRKQAVHKQATRQEGGDVSVAGQMVDEKKKQQEVFWQRTTRVAYLTARTTLRLALYSCIFPIVFGLFWMTEEQCLPTNYQGLK